MRHCKYGICQYFCYSKYIEGNYVSINMFRDLFGDMYAKPLYIERTNRTLFLAEKCQEKCLRGKIFYSLIKSPHGIYRFNKEIYEDGEKLLNLELEKNIGLAFNLMKVNEREILETIDPFQAYDIAIARNSVVAETIGRIPSTLKKANKLGLIGSIAIDPTIIVRDVDILFWGNVSGLNKIHEWLHKKKSGTLPLRRRLSKNLPTLCAFFDAKPTVYPELDSFELTSCKLEKRRACVIALECPSYLNMQVYTIKLEDETFSKLIVRDTLSRDVLNLGTRFEFLGYRSKIRNISAFLITDVEKQFIGISLHGGNTKCD